MDAHPTAAELETLYRERFLVFVRTATAQLENAEAARDVVQEAFAAALRRIDDYRGEGSLEAWLWRIVANKALDERRARARDAPAALSRHGVAAYEPNGGADEKQVIRARLAALPERQRLAVFLHYYADLDYATIASVLEVAPGTVAATLNAARTSLRKRLKEANS